METAILVGIDEAGYGPLLGPLVVSAVAFEVPADLVRDLADPADGVDLWKLLRAGVSKKPLKRGSRLPVADSKTLYDSSDHESGLQHLERAALAFLMQNAPAPAHLRELLCHICPAICDELGLYPWYAPEELALPVQCSPDGLGIQRNALRVAMEAAHVRFLGAFVEVVPEGHFNRMIEATRNKGVVLFTQTIRLIQRLTQAFNGRPMRIWADRQGGRIGYRQVLMTAFDGEPLQVLEESPERSGYCLRRAVGPFTIRFVMKGESHQLPIALASVYSKYVRELFMMSFNRYWKSQLADLRPTSGYYQDGQRFLADIDAVIARQQVERARLVRIA